MPSEPRRIAQIVKLKRESLQAYKECHAAVWPAVLQQIKDCNIIDYSIFLDEKTMTLFATMKWVGTDYEADMRAMAANPEVQKWWTMTDGMQETLVEGAKGSTDPKGWWQPLVLQSRSRTICLDLICADLGKQEEVFRFER